MAKKIKKPGKIRKSFGWAFKPFVNVTGWLGYSSVKDGYSNVKNTVNLVTEPSAVVIIG